MCCWLLEQLRQASSLKMWLYELWQDAVWSAPTLKRNLLLPFWGSLSVGWMMGRVTQFTTKTVSWKQGKGMWSQNMASANTDFSFLIGQLPCYLPTSLFCILTLLTLTTKMDTACSSEIMVWTYKTAWCQQKWKPLELT